MIKLNNVSKFYYNKNVIASGIFKINLELKIGEFVAITGESGSGKSTLLNVISGLDSYEEGEMYINNEETSHYNEKDFEDYRRKYIVNIFQNFNLVNSYTVYQNVELILLLNGYNKKEIKNRVLELVDKVGLTKFKNTKVSKLSGGQKQRVAIARALAKDTPIIIADEPTGNLDSKSAKEIIKLLSQISKDKLVIIVTHNYEQVSEYVTRKIKMHDGKILEDKKIKDYEKSIIKECRSNNITFFNKMRLGLRNTFNIKTKFLLLFLVYLFITIALLSEYSGFKKLEYETNTSGYNMFFSDISDNRIVIKKNDKTTFTEEDYTKINKLDNIEKIVKEDILLDTYIDLNSDNIYFWGLTKSLDMFSSKIDYGRMPENDYEVIVTGYEYDYYLNDLKDEVLESEFTIPGLDYKLKVVGIKYFKSSMFDYQDTYIYLSNKVASDLVASVNKNNSKVYVLFQDKYYESVQYNSYFNIIPSENVASGKVIIDSELNYQCDRYSCINKTLSITIDNPYYKDKLDLQIVDTFNANNFNKLFGLVYEEYYGSIFVNINDYNNLFDKGNYQSSVFVKDIKLIDKTIKELNDLGIKTLKIVDTLEDYDNNQIVTIFKTVVTIILIFVLFFISYFVIKLILKSRSIYFSTIRMLGANKKVSTNLLMIELFTITNLAYFVFISFIILSRKYFTINYFNNMIDYLLIKDYVILYIILVLMSLLISKRYSRKVFSKSVMKTLKEEA